MAGAEDMGASVFYEMSAKLKRAGRGDLRKQLHRDVVEAAKPLLPQVRRSAAARFPQRGGLAKHMSRGARYRAVVKTGVTTAGVSIRANRTDPRADSEGRVAHPVPGRDGRPLVGADGKRIVVVQRFPSAVGFFREPLQAGAADVRRELITRLQRWTDEVLGA